MDFVTIDFETANERRTSACSLGLCVVENGAIVESRYWLIRPEPYYFNPFNQRVHGLSERDLEGASTFNDLWPEILPFIQGRIVAAHNAPFDMSVLFQTLELYGLDCPELDILCSQRIAQSAFPSMGCYRLNIISQMMGIPLDHHNAASDAQACAQILCQLAEQANLSTLHELEEYYQITAGYYRHRCYDNYAPCRLVSQKSATRKLTAKDLKDLTPIYVDDDFAGKYFAFTGTLISMTRSKAQQIVALGGGTPQEGVTKQTNYLVVGIQDLERTNGGFSGKMKKAEELRKKGQDIQIIAEDDFISMIDDELREKCVCDEVRCHMTFDSLLNDVQAISPKWASYIEARPLADGKSCSYFFFGQMGFKVVMGKKVSRIELDPNYVKDPNAIATTSTVSSNGMLFLNTDLGFNYEGFVQVTKAICEDKKDNATVERFGCCSSFTACSDALHCLHEDDLDYLGCYYRENLEAGRIFYGKNRNI